MTATETLDKVRKLGVTLVAYPNKQFVAKGDVSEETKALVRKIVGLRRDEIWPLLDPPVEQPKPEPKPVVVDADGVSDAEYERVFDLAIDWKEYWSGN